MIIDIVQKPVFVELKSYLYKHQTELFVFGNIQVQICYL